MFCSLYEFAVSGEGYDLLTEIVDKVQRWSEKATCFRLTEKGIVFCSSRIDEEREYPITPTSIMLVETIKSYLEQRTSDEILAQAGREPSSDGAVVLGWELYKPQFSGEHGIEKCRGNEVFAVRPCWLVYPK